jgi:uncharacterized protein
MDGLTFATAPPSALDPVRMDVACFVGFVGRRLVELPAWLDRWLDANGWRAGSAGRTAADLVALRDVPVPVESWDTFDNLFLWDARPLDASGRTCDATMGAAVRRFFAQGGRKCYVVRLGDPWSVAATEAERAYRMRDILPTLPAPSPANRASWRGLGHLFGLPDVTLLCIPDLPEVFAAPPTLRRPEPAVLPVERFIECATRSEPSADQSLSGIPAPACDAAGFRRWSAAVRDAAAFLQRHAREVQLVCSMPLPIDERALGVRPDAERSMRDAREAQWREAASINARQVQLTYPWARTRSSGMLPGGLEPPDAVVAGVLADHALTRGAWKSAIRRSLPRVAGIEPVLDRGTLARAFAPTGAARGLRRDLTLRDRVTLIGPAPDGFRLISDVTTAAGYGEGPDIDESYRPANVHRLLIALLRSVRRVGEDLVFKNNDEALWRRLRERTEGMLAGFWAEGALAGATAREAFDVRCDRSTMTQADLDAGRVVLRLAFTAAAPIVHLTVVFAMEEGGHLSMLSNPLISPAPAPAAA